MHRGSTSGLLEGVQKSLSLDALHLRLLACGRLEAFVDDLECVADEVVRLVKRPVAGQDLVVDEFGEHNSIKWIKVLDLVDELVLEMVNKRMHVSLGHACKCAQLLNYLRVNKSKQAFIRGSSLANIIQSCHQLLRNFILDCACFPLGHLDWRLLHHRNISFKTNVFTLECENLNIRVFIRDLVLVRLFVFLLK